ncbi:hypothetical protein JCM16303_004246 [Sporobolomyces ruberrimus]
MESTAAPVLTRFFEWCAALGMNISRRLRERERGPLFLPKQQDDVARTITKALEHSETTFGTRAQIVFWLFDSENSLDYDKFKFKTVRRGIASQALVHKKLKHKLEDFTFHLNCVLKVNAKLGGNNFRLPHAPQDPDRVFMNAQKPMLFGADLSHQPDKPSVAVVTASMHNQGIAHEETIRIQPLLKPSPTAPPNTRATRQEILVDLEEMVFFLLCRRTEASSACPPQAIVFFRDGVSESEISQVLSVEVAAIRRAFDRFKHILLDSTSEKHREIMQVVGGSKKVGLIADLEAWNPKLTFILTIKRHHLRAFVPSSRENISPGTVIDTSVVDPRAFDFYLASHKGIKGTTRPTRYLVLTDDNTLSADAVQGFYNDAAHTLQRCNRAVSLPASVYYADIIGQRVRGWLNARNQYEASTDGPRGPPDAASRQEDLKACKLTLEETETGRNEFRAKGRAPAMWWL